MKQIVTKKQNNFVKRAKMMKCRSLIISGLISMLVLPLLTGCDGQPIESSPSPSPSIVVSTVAPSIVPEESPWQADYDFLWNILEEEYPYFSAAERITGKDFEKIKADYQARLAGVTSPYVFFNEIVTPCLIEFGLTGHLWPMDTVKYESLYQGLSEYEQDAENPKLSFLFEQMNSLQTRNFYASTKSSGYGQPTVQPLKFTVSSTENLKFRNLEGYGVGYVEIKSMRGEYSAADNATLNAFFSQLEANGYRHCVIDVQENSGGDDFYWHNNIVEPNLKKPEQVNYYGLVKGSFASEYFTAAGYDLHPIDKLPQDELPALNPQDLQGIEYFVEYVESVEPSTESPLFTGQFWVLTGPTVYSASEKFANFSKETGFATLVGTTTGGDGVGINPLICALPDSGICFSFSAALGLNTDGSCSEEVGTSPDLASNGQRNALQTCLDAILALESDDIVTP